MCWARGVGRFSLIICNAAALSDQHAGRAWPKSTEFRKNVTQVLDDLASGYSRIEFSFGGARGRDGLYPTLPHNGCTAVEHYEASDGTSGIEVGGMGRIKTSKKLVVGHVWETRQIGVVLEEFKWNVRRPINGRGRW